MYVCRFDPTDRICKKIVCHSIKLSSIIKKQSSSFKSKRKSVMHVTVTVVCQHSL